VGGEEEEGAQHNGAGEILRILVDGDGHRRKQVKRREGAETSALKIQHGGWAMCHVIL
jgi:hypothetical protein